MTPEEQKKVHGAMQGIARAVKERIPPGFGFVVFVYPHNQAEADEPMMNYVSNSRREDVIAVLREWIAKTSRGFGKDL